MTDEEAKRYAQDCKNSENLDYPLAGSILTPLCMICKNANYDTGFAKPPICAIYGTIPEDLELSRIYDCAGFVHDPTSVDNLFFDKNHKPLCV